MEHRFTLEKYSGRDSRYTCPSCDASKKFTRYIDTETGEYVGDEVGKCDRIEKCGYHFPPRIYFEDNNIEIPDTMNYKPTIVKYRTHRPPSFIPENVFQQSIGHYDANNFIGFLSNVFSKNEAHHLADLYKLGTSKHWDGATVFWQIDIHSNVPTGKIMQFNGTTGKRVKKPYDHITWCHSLMNIPNFNLNQCFFGEHLLDDDLSKPVAIVESEKTAIIACRFMPQYIWLATGGMANLNSKKCEVLRGRTVVLFPDNNCFDKWLKKAAELKHITNIKVSDFLETYCQRSGITEGIDIADLLLGSSYSEPPKIETCEEVAETSIITNTSPEPPQFFTESDSVKSEYIWNEEIASVEKFFSETELPTDMVRLNPWTVINDVPRFYQNTISVVKANDGKESFRPYLDRILSLQEIIINGYHPKKHNGVCRGSDRIPD